MSLGRYFQVRDDHQNLASSEVSITLHARQVFILILC